MTRSSHGYTTVLTGHNRSISVVYPARSVVNRDQFQTTDQIGICYGYAAVASRRLRLSTVSYGHYGRNEIFEHVQRATEKTNGGSATVDAGTSRKITVIVYGPGTDIPRIIPD